MSALALAEPFVDGDGSRRSNGHHARLTLGEAARIIREAVKDHTFATELRRVAGIDAASQALGHADLNTTLGIYGHRD